MIFFKGSIRVSSIRWICIFTLKDPTFFIASLNSIFWGSSFKFFFNIGNVFQIEMCIFFNDNILPFCDVNFDSISVFFIVYYLACSKHKLRPCFVYRNFFLPIYLQPARSNTFCWEGFGWSVDKKVLLSDEFMYFTHYCLFFLTCSRNYWLKLQKFLFQYILLLSWIIFIAFFMRFVIFAKVDWFA